MIPLLMLSLLQAPHPSYGGRLPWGVDAPELDDGLCARGTAAELLVSALAFEPLVRAGGGPSLAREIRMEGKELVVMLRTDVETHEGRKMSAAFVAKALRQNAEPCGLAGHLAGRPEDAISFDPLLASVRLELAQLPPEPAAWLAGVPIAVRREGSWLGTGPFRLDGGALVAFAGHRDGRPYLDALVFDPEADGPRPSAGGALRVDWYLRVADKDRSLTDALSAIVPSDALLRFLPEGAMALQIPRSHPGSAPAGRWRLADEPALPDSFLARLQLDLSRAGLMLELARSRRPGPHLVFMPVWSWSDAADIERWLAALRASDGLAPEVMARLAAEPDAPWAEAFARAGLVPIAGWRVAPPAGPADPRRTSDWTPSPDRAAP